MLADQARGLEPEVGGLSPAAMELNRAFVPGRLDRMVLLAECLAFRLNAANVTPCSLNFITFTNPV